MSFAPMVALGNVVDVKGGGTPSKANPAFWNGDIPWVSPKDMKFWNIEDAEDKITAGAINGSATNLIPQNSILIVNRSGILKHTLPVGITRRPVAINQDIKALICGPRAHPEYIAHLIKGAEPIILKWVRATTADNFPIENLRSLEIPLPPLDEQRRIAAILDKADDLRRKRKRALETLRGLTKTIFAEMFGNPLSKSPKWPVLTIGQAIEQGHIVEIQDGNHGERHPKVSDFSAIGFPFITANCLQDGHLNLEGAYRLTEAWLSKLRVGFGRAGDLLLSHKGTVGEVAIVPDNIGTVILSPQVTYYRLGPSLDAVFLSGLFNSPSFNALLVQSSEQSTRSYIGLNRQRELPVVIPPLSQQKRFTSAVANINALIRLEQVSLQGSNVLFSSLQHRAFSGQL